MEFLVFTYGLMSPFTEPRVFFRTDPDIVQESVLDERIGLLASTDAAGWQLIVAQSALAIEGAQEELHIVHC